MSYDQWKTASPYDDEPDIAFECYRQADSLKEYLDSERSILDAKAYRLILTSIDTLRYAADHIMEE